MTGKQVIAPLFTAALYVAAGKAALLLALSPGYASAVFPPAGIALAAAFIGGRALLPGVFLGSLTLNLWAGYAAGQQPAVAAALLIALASTLQAALGGSVLRRAIGYPAALDNLRDIVTLILLTPAICLVSATLAVAGLWALGVIDSGAAPQNWGAWWIGDTLGALVVFPAAMTLLAEPRALWKGRIKTVVLPILLALTLIVLAFFRTSRWEQEQSRADIRERSEHVLSQLYTHFDEQSTIALEMGAMFAQGNRNTLSREEFRRFAQVMLRQFPVLQALEWAPRVTPAERPGFEAAQRQQVAAFRITERGADGAMHPAGPRDFYYPVTYVEPYRGNEAALGYDLASNPARNHALLSTARTGQPAATAPIPLVQTGGRPGVLIIQAVPENGRPSAVLTVLDIRNFIAHALPASSASLHVRLVDTDADTVIYDTFPAAVQRPAFDQPIEFASRHYRFQTLPTAAYLQAHRSWQAWGVMAGGTLGAALLGALLLLATGYTARVVAQVDERTRELQESEARFRAMADSSPVFIWLADRHNQVTWFNQTLLTFLGQPMEQELGGAWARGLHPEDRNVLEAFARHAARREPFQMEFRLMRHDGAYRWILDTGIPRFDQHNSFLGYIGSGIDVTERKEASELIKHLAHYDALTDLPNRAMFLDRLKVTLASARRDKTRFALMFVDIDNFKPINDQLGHHTGDLLLVEIAGRMRHAVRESDTVARIGGDEFVVIAPAIGEDEDAVQVAEKVRQALCEPFRIETHTLSVSSSIGIALYPEHGEDDHQLMRNADSAMYQAKNSGRNNVKVYRPEAAP